MKKQLFTLMLATAILTKAPLFAMNQESEKKIYTIQATFKNKTSLPLEVQIERDGFFLIHEDQSFMDSAPKRKKVLQPDETWTWRLSSPNPREITGYHFNAVLYSESSSFPNFDDRKYKQLSLCDTLEKSPLILAKTYINPCDVKSYNIEIIPSNPSKYEFKDH